MKQKTNSASLDPKDFILPPEGLTEDKRKQCLDDFTAYIQTQKSHFLGYQANQQMDYKDDTMQFLDCHVNNIGDPFRDGNFTANSKIMEKAVLDYYAQLWKATIPHSPNTPESYWGYVLTMGSSEGNLYGLWNARDYLAGRKLIVDDPGTKSRRISFLQAKTVKGKENAYTPVAFFSEDTHYSIIKAMRVLQIPTFYEIGKKFYPGKNPLDPHGQWTSEYQEVPSLAGKDGPGCIDIDKLEILVKFFASEGYPILICANYGTTFKGAYDDVEAIGKRLMPIFTELGLVNRKVEYESGKFDTRNGYWIHVDGALGASFMPFIEKAKEKKLISDSGPVFDFRLPCVNSIVMSGHKWPGAPWPCGIFMTKVKYQLFPPDDPEYIGSPDTTFSGSRNGFSAVIMWDYLARHSYDRQMDAALRGEKLAQYAEAQLKTVQPFHQGIELWVERTPLALTVRFHKPNDKIVKRYSLSCETLEIKGELRTYAHIFIMNAVTENLINELIEDLKAPDAFEEAAKAAMAVKMAKPVLALERSRGWR